MSKSVVNKQLLALLYGQIVNQVVRDSEDIFSANKRLYSMGLNVGSRLLVEYVCKESKACTSFKEIVNNLCGGGLQFFLGARGTYRILERYVPKQGEKMEQERERENEKLNEINAHLKSIVKKGEKALPRVFQLEIKDQDNPVLRNVYLPPQLSELSYLQLFAGCVMGALTSIGLKELRTLILEDGLKKESKRSVIQFQLYILCIDQN